MLHRLISLLIFLLIWELLSLFFPPLVVPPIRNVLKKLSIIVTGKKFGKTISVTLLRFLSGIGIGVGIGAVFGLLFGLSRRVEEICAPYISILQSVPPVCWVVLALVWFGFNGKPCVFIVATASVPPMVINLAKGVHSIDPQLTQMAKLYHFSRQKTLRHVILPSIRPYFLSALDIVVGGGWKLVVMGEVLTTSTGIGGAITTARLNIEPDAIIAWAVILMALCYATQWLLRLALRSRGATYAGM